MKHRHIVERDLRSEILDVLRRSAAPVQLLELSKALGIRSDAPEYEALRATLTRMADAGAISRHPRRRFGLAERDVAGFTGTIRIRNDQGSVQTDDPDIPIIHIRREHLATALDGDVVQVKPLALRHKKRTYGEVVAIVDRSTVRIGGTVEYDGSFYHVVPDEAKHYVDFLVAKKNLHGARPGDKVIARFLRWEHLHASPEVVVEEVLGTSGNPSVEFDAIVKEFGLPTAFPADVEADAMLCSPPSARVPKHREDLRKLDVITIDPDDARDFDDALSLTPLEGGAVELGVHIADVTHYVAEDSPLDREARHRGNSTYLVDRVVPMLPERLSNDLCSLVPGKPRYAFSVFMTFSARGILKNYRIVESVIHSKRRFTYDEALTIIQTRTGDYAELLHRLYKLSRVLNARRMKTGGINFHSQELRFVLDERKHPVRAVVKSATDATSLVEECMLAANRTVAEHITKLQHQWRTKSPPPTIYRIHDDPNPEKLADAVAVVRAMGIPVPSGKLTPSDLNAILDAAKDRPDAAAINTLLLRAMSKAVYAEANIGHYGLGFTDYSHFTSPIRRYPDLFVHRVLKEYGKGQPSKGRWNHLLAQAEAVADHCSQCERNAIDAERASVKCAQVMMARTMIGDVRHGTVSGVTTFGVFVTLDDVHIEGLLHIRDITDDYYFFDERRFRLIGRRTRRTFAFGTRVAVKVVKADIEKRMIDFILADSDDH
jgi:ribonuclease R